MPNYILVSLHLRFFN